MGHPPSSAVHRSPKGGVRLKDRAPDPLRLRSGQALAPLVKARGFGMAAQGCIIPESTSAQALVGPLMNGVLTKFKPGT